jgi:hypothetical protein
MEQLEQSSQNGGQAEWETGRMGDRQNQTARTKLPEQDCQHKAAKIRQLGQDETKRTAEKTAITGQLE